MSFAKPIRVYMMGRLTHFEASLLSDNCYRLAVKAAYSPDDRPTVTIETVSM